MNVLVDTSVWSLALRRDRSPRLLGRLCIRYDLALLTADRDFDEMARHSPLTLLRS